MADDGFVEWYAGFVNEKKAVPNVKDSWQASRRAAIEECCAAVLAFAENYPLDVFPDSNNAANWARKTIANCEDAIRRAFADDEEVVEEPKSFANVIGALAGPEFADLDEMEAETPKECQPPPMCPEPTPMLDEVDRFHRGYIPKVRQRR